MTRKLKHSVFRSNSADLIKEPSEMCSRAEGQLLQIQKPFVAIDHKWLIILVQILMPWSAGILLLYSKTVPIITVMYIRCHLRMFQEHVKNLDEYAEELSKQRNIDLHQSRLIVLKWIVRKHQHVIR